MYCGKAIWPHNEERLENLARYIIRASFSQERMTYIAADESANDVAKVIYESKDGNTSKTFELILTTKTALVSRMIIVCIIARFNMLGCLVPS